MMSDTVPSPKEVTFTNKKGESFHLSIFSPPHEVVEQVANPIPVLLCVHGAGMSGESFTRLARLLELPRHNGSSVPRVEEEEKPAAERPRPLCAPMMPRPPMSGGSPFLVGQSEGQAEDIDMHVVTFDLRCHGTSTYDGGEGHLTMEVLMSDFLEILDYAKAELFPQSSFYVLGHSLGGAVVSRALSGNAKALERVAGAIIVDIVEGTAKLSLNHMSEFLRKRPTSFATVEEAMAWFLHHGGMRTPEGTSVSVPPLLRFDEEAGVWVWRTELGAMSSVWDGWFTGLDKAFVSLACPKMLCLANPERLDKELTIAQMQGSFQFEVMGNNCGHYVMDDAPAVMAAKLRRFVKRIEVLSRTMKAATQRYNSMHMNTATVPPKPGAM